MVVDRIRRPAPVGARGRWILAILAALAWAVWQLDLELGALLPSPARLRTLREFFGAALQPDLSPAVLSAMVRSSWNTIVFAVAAMTLALVLGVTLGFFASTAWWSATATGRSDGARAIPRFAGPVLYFVVRSGIAVFRSIHELFWAVLFLIAMGINPFSGVLAIAIPYGCTLAKVFSEVIDEAPRDSAVAMRATGASAMQVYSFGLVPRALPDMTAYAFYRFECALRSAAVLGFFGFETLGYFIKGAFQDTDYAQTWTFLYALLALVLAADWWSGAFRRSLAR